MPIDERTRVLRTKKRRVKITPLSADELRVPPTKATHPPVIPFEINVSDEESEEKVEPSPSLVRKRKHSSDNPSMPPLEPTTTKATPPLVQPIPSPQKPSSSEARPEAVASPTLWPYLNENFPFQLYNSFVRDTDDHRFGNNSIMDLIDAEMMHQARANDIFGRLHKKYKEDEAEAEEDAARKENIILKSALAWEKGQLGDAIFNNECLRKELAKVKEQLETTEEINQTTVRVNVDLVRKNESQTQSNQSLAREINNAKVIEERHLAHRRKIETKLRELKALGPPLTEELCKQIQLEYRKSPELNEEIIKMYAEGYETAQSKGKAKLAATSVNPTLLDSSDDEDEDNA